MSPYFTIIVVLTPFIAYVYFPNDIYICPRIGWTRSILALRDGECITFHISFLFCRLSQKSGLFPKTFAKIKAVSTVIDRLLLHNSLTVFRLTIIAFARSPCVRFKGSKNSVIIISPTDTGCRFVVIMPSTLPVTMVVEIHVVSCSPVIIPLENKPPLIVNSY